jgi:hypothetical protein
VLAILHEADGSAGIWHATQREQTAELLLSGKVA